MQLAAFLRNDRRAGLAAAFTLTIGLLAGSLGCGGASNGGSVVLPPGGIAIGELVCAIASSIPGDVVVQGEVITVTFRITDVNQRLVGQFLPVSWEVQGGYLANPVDITDVNGEVTVYFVTDPNYIGNAFVRLIQPEYDLRCDITFRMVKPACILEGEIQDDMGMTLQVGCGSSVMMTRDEARVIVWTVSRPNSVNGVIEPVAGAYLWVTTAGQVPTEFQIGPTDAAGMVSLEVSETGGVMPHPTQVGTVVVTAEVIIPDENADGLEDSLPCDSCSESFDISDPPCDQDGGMVAIAYPFMNVLRPGEFATLSLTLTRNAVPIANEALTVFAQHGTLNGSANPIIVMTDAAGQADVVYEPFVGFGGTIADPAVDLVSFQASGSAIQCQLTGEVNVATCGLELAFAPPAKQGVVSAVTVTVTNVDTATSDGRTVSLNSTGGALSPPVDVSGPLAGATRMINYTAGNTVTGGSISLNFIDGYPCQAVTETFSVLPSP